MTIKLNFGNVKIRYNPHIERHLLRIKKEPLPTFATHKPDFKTINKLAKKYNKYKT